MITFLLYCFLNYLQVVDSITFVTSDYAGVEAVDEEIMSSVVIAGNFAAAPRLICTVINKKIHITDRLWVPKIEVVNRIDLGIRVDNVYELGVSLVQPPGGL